MTYYRKSRAILGTATCITSMCLIAVALPMSPASAVTGDYAEFSVDAASSAPTEIANLGGDVLWTSLSSAGKLAKIGMDGKSTVIAPSGMATTAAPAGLALGGDKRIWVAESAGNRIGALDPKTGTYVAFSLPKADSGPTSLATATDGSIWFTEKTGSRIGRIDNSGKITEFALSADSGPLGIILGGDGAMWFTSSTANAIGRITPSGVTTSFALPNANSTPVGIALGPDGNVWFTEATGNRIGRITPAGTITEFKLPVANSAPLGITALPDGNMWFSESAANRVGLITMSGGIVEYSMQQGVRPSGIAAGSDGNAWFTQPTVSKVARLLSGVLPANTTVPAVTPLTSTLGATLTATPGTWNFSPTSYSYRWQRCTAATPSVCSNITEATKSTYVVSAADSALRVQVLVTATNLNGQADKGSMSNQVAITSVTPAITPSVKPNPVTGQRSIQIGSGVNATILRASIARRGKYQKFTLQMSNSSVRGQVRMAVLNSAATTVLVIAPRKSVNARGIAKKAKRIPYRLAKGTYTLQMTYTPIAQQEFMYSSATIAIPLRIR